MGQGSFRIALAGVLAITLSLIHVKQHSTTLPRASFRKSSRKSSLKDDDVLQAGNITSRMTQVLADECVHEIVRSSNKKKNGTGLLQISQEHKVLFVHIPKTGGTSIERSKLFYDRSDPEKRKPGGHTAIQRYHHRVPESKNYTSFAIVRNPCERFLSAFYYMQQGGQHNGDKTWMRENIGKMTLEEWVQNGIKDTAAHFKPMWHYVFLPETRQQPHVMGVDEIFCQEDFGEAIQWINSTYGDGTLFPEIPYKNKGVVSHGGCQALSEETRQGIQHFYAMDYCIFGYNSSVDFTAQSVCQTRGVSKDAFTHRFAECRKTIMGDEPLVDTATSPRQRRRKQQQQKRQRRQRQKQNANNGRL